MFDKPNALQTVGLELEDSSLRGVQLSLNKGHAVLDRVFDVKLDPNPDNRLPTDEGQAVLRLIHKNLSITSLPASEVIIRPLEVKLKKERDIDAVLAFQAEPLLPYPTDEAILDRVVLSQEGDGTQMILTAARKDYIEAHLTSWNSLQIEPEVLSCDPVALAFFSKQFVDSAEPHFVVHLGKTHTTCILVKEGLILASHAGHAGLNTFDNALKEDQDAPIQSIDFSALDPQKTPRLCAEVDAWKLEITRLLYALSKQNKGQEMPSILLTGAGAGVPHLGALLCERVSSKFLEPIANDNFPLSTAELVSYAIPIGAALSALPNAKNQINFLSQEFTYAKPWKRFTKPLAGYFALCCLLAAAFFIFGEAYLSYQEDQMRQEYANLLGVLNKSYPAFEKEFIAKHPSDRELEDGMVPLSVMTKEEVMQRLQYLHKELKSTPDSFPLQPNTPRVSDVLAWISTHPNALGKDEGSGKHVPLQIESFSYTLVKRPEPKKPQEKYQVKIELEFTTQTPKMAREFHDALISPNDIVDPKGEVKWGTNRGKYRTSFYLKDKTLYPAN